ncbi:mechanosensitive ion channel family protein [Histidinibacterium aquaticum]|uniref:Mechanosensitive ion channel n=1 Tax=Histidinibacterium aquaticum TaxID=2613962 RepID=A0A5J5GLP0_9RHOB|nr:mechanosensitive ion channel domain-containing protein [Histidinibacterium aquaticum]KAA9008947.1 mechanosensitive ion channel [Histidinibacterium aquaticum]
MRAPALYLALIVSVLLSAGQQLVAQQDQSSNWYEIDELNPGLGAAPEDIDRATPQAAMESFMFRASEGDWESAAHVLDLASIPEEAQAEIGPERAKQLYTIIDRKIIVDWHMLLDRPDGLNARAPSDSAMSGEPRRSLLLWIVDLPERPVTIRLNRVKAEGEDAAWVFSRQSVENLPALADRFGPSALEQMLPDPLRTRAFWGLRWWEVIALPLMIAVATLLGSITYSLMSRGLHRTRRDDGSSSLLVAMRPPAVLAVVTLTVGLMTKHLFVFSGRIDTVLSPLIAIGFVSVTLWAIINAVDTLLDRLVQFDGGELSSVAEGQERKRQFATKIAAARRAIIVIVVIFGAGIVLREANMMQTLGFSLLASASVTTLVLAFAARNVLANIMASMQIAMNQSAKMGDKLLYQGYMCSVERINFTFVQLRVWTGKRLIVPVSEFVAEPFENWTMQEPFMIMEIRLRLAHGADIEPLRKRYFEILDQLDEGGEPHADSRGVYVSNHDVFGMEALFMVPCEDPNTAWARACEVRERLLRAAADLEMEAEAMFPDANPAEAA